MFASAREAAGTGRDDVPGTTVGDVLSAARQRYGQQFADVLETCRIWVNGDPAADTTTVGPERRDRRAAAGVRGSVSERSELQRPRAPT